MASVHITNFDRFVTPAHDLTRSNVGNRSGHFTPLQKNILADLAVSVHVHTFVIITKQQLHSFRVGQGYDRMRLNGGQALQLQTQFVMKSKNELFFKRKTPTNQLRDVNVRKLSIVKIDRMKPLARTVDDLELD